MTSKTTLWWLTSFCRKKNIIFVFIFYSCSIPDLSLTCPWRRHKGGSWTCRWKTAECSTHGRGRTLAWYWMELLVVCVDVSTFSVIDVANVWFSTGDNRTFTDGSDQGHHRMVQCSTAPFLAVVCVLFHSYLCLYFSSLFCRSSNRYELTLPGLKKSN